MQLFLKFSLNFIIEKECTLIDSTFRNNAVNGLSCLKTKIFIAEFNKNRTLFRISVDEFCFYKVNTRVLL